MKDHAAILPLLNFLTPLTSQACATPANVLTRRHGFSLLLLLGLLSDPHEHLVVTETLLGTVRLSHFSPSVEPRGKALCSSPAPRCRGSWHHLWQDRLGSSPRVPPQSAREEGRMAGGLVRLHWCWCCGSTKGLLKLSDSLTHLHLRDFSLWVWFTSIAKSSESDQEQPRRLISEPKSLEQGKLSNTVSELANEDTHNIAAESHLALV